MRVLNFLAILVLTNCTVHIKRLKYYIRTIAGRLIGSIAVVLGIVILALPMTVIVSKFNDSYGDVKRTTEKDQLKKVRAHAIAHGAIF